MSRKRKELQQVIEEKLIENILLEWDEDNTDSDDEQEDTSEIFMLGLLVLNNIRYLEPRIYNVAKSQYTSQYWYNNILR